MIDWDNYESDPIYHLTFPQKGMLRPHHFTKMANALHEYDDKSYHKTISNQIRLQLNPHPAGQADGNVPTLDGVKLWGIQHKYRETVLFFPSAGQTCHSYCTFCFRYSIYIGSVFGLFSYSVLCVRYIS